MKLSIFATLALATTLLMSAVQAAEPVIPVSGKLVSRAIIDSTSEDAGGATRTVQFLATVETFNDGAGAAQRVTLIVDEPLRLEVWAIPIGSEVRFRTKFVGLRPHQDGRLYITKIISGE